MTLINRFLPAITIIVALLAWEVAVRLLGVREFILPPPSVIGRTFFEIAPELGSHLWATLSVLFSGYFLGVLFGITLAVVMIVLPPVRRAVYPLVVASQTIPKIAIAPLLILWFGVGMQPKIFMVALLAFFPVLVNTVAGLESTDRGHLELMKSVNASLWQVYRHVRLPAAVPQIFAGFKLALTVSVIGAVVGEWVVGNRGVGYLLLAYNSSLMTANVFATLAVIVFCSAVCFFAITFAERRLSWRARLS